MLTLLFMIMGMTITMWISPNKKTWTMSMLQTSTLLMMSLVLIMTPKSYLISSNMSLSLSNKVMSGPLIILSCWLIPVALLAKMKTLSKYPMLSQQTFLSMKLFILATLMMTFSTTKLIMFFIAFESTLMPTLLLMSRWGMQYERMEAGYYFMFYTLISSLPLFMGLITLYANKSKMKMPLNWWKQNSYSPMLASFCMMAFLVKVPIYSLHLWLPKAHVEAPMAGSMMLAAILLKMGGYGFIRMYFFFLTPVTKILSPILIFFCSWGGLMTSLICFSQTDLKSLMAYSSVSHMSFMMAGMATGTSWAIKASIMIMISHGLVSSALFALANLFYEQSSTRTLTISRGLKTTISLLPMWWLLFASANLGLPPFPNAMGEILKFSSIISWSTTLFPVMAGSVVLTSIFSLTIYQLLNNGWSHKWKTLSLKINERENLLITLHLLPLMAIILIPNLLSQ